MSLNTESEIALADRSPMSAKSDTVSSNYASRERVGTPTVQATSSLASPPDVFPEGTLWGWLSVLGGFCLSISVFGFVNSWSTFQAYYEEISLSSPSSIAWIGSVQYSLIFLPGIVAGRVFDAGYFRISLFGSGVLFVTASILIAQCRVYWHFLLCQGFALGIACGWIYVPGISVISQWFKAKRPIAFSIASVGVSVGGIIFPIMFRNLLPAIGFAWTIRAMTLVHLSMFIIANFTMYPRLKPSKNFGGSWIIFSDFRQLQFTIYVLSTFVAFLGLYTMLTFLSVSAVSIGISSSLAFYLVSTANATSAIGRLFSGIIAIKYGPINTMIVFTSVAVICTYVWPFVTTTAGFIVVTCFYGVSSGAYIGLFPLGVSSVADITTIGRRTGVLMSIMALGALFGPPISGAILDAANSFKPVGVYAGTMIAVSILMMIATRVATLHRLYGGKV